MIREPIAAGQFYPGSSDGLRKMLESMVDDRADKVEAIGLISPHAGYIYSGMVAGAVISKIKLNDTVVILGPNHTGRGKGFSIVTKGSWITPLGDTEIDTELGKQILTSSSYLEEDYVAHQFEHSLEVQVPFLQYFRPDVRIVPIVIAHARGNVYKKIGKEIAAAIKESNKKVTILASSDMTHYESQESVRKKDSKAIEAILNLDEDELLKRVADFDISMCGYAPVVSLISAAKEMGAKKAELVKYQTSGDASGDYSSVVGYAGILLK
ncbi:MAG: AmmeMemoRadiSam system protein B [Dehalococcoidia bacterium]|nr:AmmeMemoRadiSam system protein B [Dehalococcoidia bacterium]